MEITTEGLGELMAATECTKETAFSKLPAVGYKLDGDWGMARFSILQGDGFQISSNEYAPVKDGYLRARSELPLLELHINLGNDMHGEWDGVRQESFLRNQFNISYTPHVQTRAKFRAGQQYKGLDFHLERSFLDKYISYYPKLGRFLEKADKGIPGSLCPEGTKLNAQMAGALCQLRENSISTIAQPVFAETKVAEIVINALDILCGHKEKIPVKLSNEETERLILLREKLNNPDFMFSSLNDLSKTVCMNTDKLKKGFRQLFGTSIYDFHMEAKLSRAMELVKEGKESIGNIAYITGYDYPPGFNKAFKKRFGLFPGQIRKKN